MQPFKIDLLLFYYLLLSILKVIILRCALYFIARRIVIITAIIHTNFNESHNTLDYIEQVFSSILVSGDGVHTFFKLKSK